MTYKLFGIWLVFTFSSSLLISQIISSLTYITLQACPSTLYAVLQSPLLPQRPCMSWSLYLGWVSLFCNYQTPWGLASPSCQFCITSVTVPGKNLHTPVLAPIPISGMEWVFNNYLSNEWTDKLFFKTNSKVNEWKLSVIYINSTVLYKAGNWPKFLFYLFRIKTINTVVK